MIQRIQSLWLLIAAALGVLSFAVPFYEATNQNLAATSVSVAYVNGGSNFFLIILTGAVILTALISIFLYKDRKMQLRISLLGGLLALINIFLYFSAMKKLGGSVPSITAIIDLAIPVFFVLAARGIWKDEKLVKSLDRLR